MEKEQINKSCLQRACTGSLHSLRLCIIARRRAQCDDKISAYVLTAVIIIIVPFVSLSSANSMIFHFTSTELHWTGNDFAFVNCHFFFLVCHISIESVLWFVFSSSIASCFDVKCACNLERILHLCISHLHNTRRAELFRVQHKKS